MLSVRERRAIFQCRTLFAKYKMKIVGSELSILTVMFGHVCIIIQYDDISIGVPAKAIFGPKRCIFQIFFSYHFYSKIADMRYLPTLVIPSGASIHTACPHFRPPSMCYHTDCVHSDMVDGIMFLVKILKNVCFILNVVLPPEFPGTLDNSS